MKLNKAYVGDAYKLVPQLKGKVQAIITDPPYGGNFDFDYAKRKRSKHSYKTITGDNKPFDPRILLGICDSVVIFGYDYFPSLLPVIGGKYEWECQKCGNKWSDIIKLFGVENFVLMDTCKKCTTVVYGKFVGTESVASLIVWDKRVVNEYNDNSDFEIAWCNKKGARRMFRHQWSGCCRETERDEMGLHPTQKPVELGVFLVERFSKPGDIVLDPFCGSGFVPLACEQLGRDWIAFDIEEDYVRITNTRVEARRKGLRYADIQNGQIGLFESQD